MNLKLKFLRFTAALNDQSALDENGQYYSVLQFCPSLIYLL